MSHTKKAVDSTEKCLFFAVTIQKLTTAHHVNFPIKRKPIIYDVCSGLSNQLYGHAAQIATAIVSKRHLVIPDIFLLNGIQSDMLVDSSARREQSIPLSKVIDTDELIAFIFIWSAVIIYLNELRKE